MKIGAHMSIADGLHLSFGRGKEIGCKTMQIFTKNATRWREKKVTDEETSLFKKAQEETEIGPVVSHDSYLINMASPDDAKRDKSLKAFLGELERAEQLGLSHVVTHPGSHTGGGEEMGLKLFAESLKVVQKEVAGYQVKIALETTAGQGSSLGYKFEHFAKIFDLIDDPDGCSVCLDTAHIYAAGYDIKSGRGLENTLKEFDKVIGLRMLDVIHVNDSKKELGSRVDRHEHIGEGYLGLEPFRYILHNQALQDTLFILETPVADGGHAKNMDTLRELLSRPPQDE